MTVHIIHPTRFRQEPAAIFDHADEISAENAKGAELSLENATSGMTIPFHKGAARYYAEHGITVDTKGE